MNSESPIDTIQLMPLSITSLQNASLVDGDGGAAAMSKQSLSYVCKGTNELDTFVMNESSVHELYAYF